MYKIIRHYSGKTGPDGHLQSHRRAVNGMSGLTLEETQAHCSDPETSSSTCQQATNVRRTRKRGEWFDGYTENLTPVGPGNP